MSSQRGTPAGTAGELIRRLRLAPHPEGGFYRETYRTAETVGARALSTAIYYLLAAETVSALHRLASDEVFHFYGGDPVEMLLLRPDGTGRVVVLGSSPLEGIEPQAIVPKGVWQGARLKPGGAWALLGTTVAPGFDFADFEPGRRAELLAAYPAFATLIVALTSP